MMYSQIWENNVKGIKIERVNKVSWFCMGHEKIDKCGCVISPQSDVVLSSTVWCFIIDHIQGEIKYAGKVKLNIVYMI